MLARGAWGVASRAHAPPRPPTSAPSDGACHIPCAWHAAGRAITSADVACEAETGEGELAGAQQVEALRAEVAVLTRRVEALLDAQERPR